MFLNACFMMIDCSLRWNPPFPLGARSFPDGIITDAFYLFSIGLPHRGIHADEIDGKYIPKGATVLANIWYENTTLYHKLLPHGSLSYGRYMMHDEKNYENPEAFYPERFHHWHGQQKSIIDPASAVFGFGRRSVCHVHIANMK